MLLSNYQLSEKKERLVLLLLFLISIFSRIPVIFAYGDTNLENEWGVIVNNLITHNTFAFDYYDDSVNKECKIVKSNDDKLLYKSNDEYTSPLVAMYRVGADIILETQNTIYIVSGKMI